MSFEPSDAVRRRLADDTLAWLTTVSPKGRPAPRPIWFLWDDGRCVIYSQPGAAKLAHLAANEHATLNFNANATGGDVVVLAGRARLLPDAPSPEDLPGLREKYYELAERIGLSWAGFVSAYIVALEFVPEREWTID